MREFVRERALHVVGVATQHDAMVALGPQALGVGDARAGHGVEARRLLDPDLQVVRQDTAGDHGHDFGGQAVQQARDAVGLGVARGAHVSVRSANVSGRRRGHAGDQNETQSETGKKDVGSRERE